MVVVAVEVLEQQEQQELVVQLDQEEMEQQIQ
jgi:hypothetical protein